MDGPNLFWSRLQCAGVGGPSWFQFGLTLAVLELVPAWTDPSCFEAVCHCGWAQLFWSKVQHTVITVLEHGPVSNVNYLNYFWSCVPV